MYFLLNNFKKYEISQLTKIQCSKMFISILHDIIIPYVDICVLYI